MSRPPPSTPHYHPPPPVPGSRTDDDDPAANYHYYYEYHHGRGEHVLVRADPDVNRPRFSVKCIACQCLDCLILTGCILFLYFSIRYALYLLDNADGGGGR